MKPIVYYTKPKLVVVGQGALVTPMNHPGNENDGSYHAVVNGEPVVTSTVLSYTKEIGQFETKNTIYKLFE